MELGVWIISENPDIIPAPHDLPPLFFHRFKPQDIHIFCLFAFFFAPIDDANIV
jgi:hypothetical protein